MTRWKELHWDIKNTAEDVAVATVELVLASAAIAIEDHDCFHLVLAGGGTPKRAYELLAQASVDWSGWRFYYGDERCLPADHKERNSVMVQGAWLNRIPLQSGQHFPIPAELGARAGANKYRDMIASIDAFDLVLLGMGEDGHTASLFPNQVWQADARVLAVNDAPKPPPQRISLGPAAIHRARQRCFIVTGASKSEAVAQWRQDVELPITRAALAGDRIIIDRAAWGQD